MNAAYAQQSSPPLLYRDGPPAAPPPQYHMPPQHSMPIPQQSQQSQMVAGHEQPYGGFAPLAPGTQPPVHDPLPRSCVENGRKYELRVVQQPRRARMCGFGDKDRRPITPPPCVRLVITDANTGKEIDCNEIDHAMFVLNVDLWSADGHREVNLVRHSATSPSISATTPVSYQDMTSTPAFSSILPGHSAQRDVKFEPGQGPGFPTAPYNPYPGGPAVNPYGQQSNQQPPYPLNNQYNSGYAPTTNGSQAYPPQNGYHQPSAQPSYYTTGAGIHAQGNHQHQGGEYSHPSQQLPSSSQLTSHNGRPYQAQPADITIPRLPVSSTAPVGMYTRNLIGSLAASAFRLTDPNDHIGIWFVLQDLSVRTEGTFRLRFSFVNVGVLPSLPSADHSQGGGHQPQQQMVTQVNTGKAPVLAACFSEVFTVYSAKRFPGVVESTPLSKCFATQGIKIPIRKDGPGKGDKNADEYED